jgi:hypothetical protein
MASFAVSGVRLNAYALFPVVDERYCAPEFTAWAPLVWRASCEPKIIPQTAHINTGSIHSFTVYGRAEGTPEEIAHMKEVPLTALGRLKTSLGDVVQIDARVNIQCIWFETGADMVIDVVGWDLKRHMASGRPVTDPWAFVGDVDWELCVGDSPPLRSPTTTSLEIYFVCPSPLVFLKKEGVPARLLRFALGHTSAANNDEGTPYPAAITERVFKSGFQYERSAGSNAFTNGAGCPFLLGKWLTLWTILDGTASEETRETYKLRNYSPQEPPTVNCYDQAGILGLCLSLAFASQEDYNALKCYFMKPFGFLQETYLVGFPSEKCNNPFAGPDHPDALMVERTSELRSHFGNHVFLGWKDRIYDACAGPVSGQYDLAGYVDTAIDKEHAKKVWDGDHKLLMTEAEITGTPESARHHPVTNDHRGILGELQDAVKKGPWDIPARDKLVRDLQGLPNSGGKPFAFDAVTFGEWFRTKFSSDAYTVKAVSPAGVYTGAGSYDDDSYRRGLIEWEIIVEDAATGSAGTQHHVKLVWRVFSDAKQAHIAHTSRLDPADPEPDEYEKDSLVSGMKHGVSHAIAVHGRHTLHVSSSELALEKVQIMARDISEYGTESKETVEMFVGHPEADPERGFQSSPLVVDYDDTKEFSIDTKNVEYIDWSYKTGVS